MSKVEQLKQESRELTRDGKIGEATKLFRSAWNLENEDRVMEKMSYDEKGENICRAIEPRQKVHIEIEIIDMQDSDAIRDAINKLGYVRTFFGLTPDQHIKMEFEKKGVMK